MVNFRNNITLHESRLADIVGVSSARYDSIIAPRFPSILVTHLVFAAIFLVLCINAFC
jgi:hypothetical protein